MAVDLVRAFVDWDYRESLVGLSDPEVTLLRRAGAFAYDHHETVDFTDWNGAIVGRGAGSLLRAAIPLDPTLPFSEFEPLLGKGVGARVVVAQHPSTPLATLLALAEDPDLDVQLALFKNESGCTGVVFERLCRSPFIPVRERAAGDARLTLELRELLLADPVPSVCMHVLWRKDLDAATLAALAARDSVHGVSIARHANATPELLLVLASSKSAATRLAVAERPLASRGALEVIWEQERDLRIKRALASHAATPAAILDQLVEEPEFRLALARRTDLSAQAQRICAASSDVEVRQSVAKCGTELQALGLLLKDSSTSVRATLAKNPHWRSLEDLALDEMSTVRRSVAERADAPRGLLELLATDSQSEVSRAAERTLAAIGGAKKA